MGARKEGGTASIRERAPWPPSDLPAPQVFRQRRLPPHALDVGDEAAGAHEARKIGGGQGGVRRVRDGADEGIEALELREIAGERDAVFGLGLFDVGER